MRKAIEQFFKLKSSGTTISREFLAGITTFLTMSYIIFVNPAILSDTGMDYSAVLGATVLVCSISSIFMGLYANLPYALAPGMGINAFFTYTLVISKGIAWQTALAAVFVSGIIFIILTLFKIRTNIVKAIPVSLRYALAAGIGIFITFIGLQKAGIIVSDPTTLVAMGKFNISFVLASLGLIVTAIMLLYGYRFALLAGIIITTAFGVVFDNISLPAQIVSIPALDKVLFQMDFKGLLTISMISPVFTFLFTDMFDSISTFLGVSHAANILDKDGNPKNISKALLVDAFSTTISGILGTSSGTTYVESAAGVEEGGRTGLVAVVVGFLFLPFFFFSSLASIIPSYATSPALILVGLYMMSAIAKIDFSDIEEGLPAFLAIVMIPLTYSITQGIVWGFISYILLKLAKGKARQLSFMMYIIFLFSLLALFTI